MLAKRIIPCLDVKDGKVIKGVQFRNHQVVGDILDLALRYRDEGADELVFYDITASSEDRYVDKTWIEKIARILDIPFCVAGGIRNAAQAREILNYGADKISINSPAIENPDFIDDLVDILGSQCVVIGIDSMEESGAYFVYQYTGDESRTKPAQRRTMEWAMEVQKRGAGEIVLNCMNRDGVRTGYDIQQLKTLRETVTIPVIASGGAGEMSHFAEVFKKADVDGALAASVFHKAIFTIGDLKHYLKNNNIEVRL